MPAQGGKLKNFLDVSMLKEVKAIVDVCSLLSLMDCLQTMLDSQLLTTFVKRWNKETSSFHLPFNEMTITLDNVSFLFHLPLEGSFLTTPLTIQELARMTLVHDLGIIEEEVIDKFRDNRGAHFSLTCLRDRYRYVVRQSTNEAVATVYILHRVGCTILVDKSHEYINAKYTWWFNLLEHCIWE